MPAHTIHVHMKQASFVMVVTIIATTVGSSLTGTPRF